MAVKINLGHFFIKNKPLCGDARRECVENHDIEPVCIVWPEKNMIPVWWGLI